MAEQLDPQQAPVQDDAAELAVTDRTVLHEGKVFDLVGEQVDLGAGGVVYREFLAHPGAVAVVALDEADQVALVRQYRHPVRSYLWEVPAGLLDVPGESLLSAAQRELAEEADLVAGTWHTLVDFATTPGGSDERIRIFLARDLHQVPAADRYQREAEELDMPLRWMDLDEALAAVLAGRLHNPSAVAGILAAHAARAADWRTLRPAEATDLLPR